MPALRDDGGGGMREDITVIRGDSVTLVVTVTDAAGLAYDLTGAAVAFTVGTIGIEKTVGAGITVSTPATGVASIAVGPTDTEDAPDQRTAYPYDVQITLADGSAKTPIRGLFIVLPDVTT
jgi:hypothetical protein